MKQKHTQQPSRNCFLFVHQQQFETILVETKYKQLPTIRVGFDREEGTPQIDSIEIQMASLNATDANMPVALESFDDSANNPNEESQMADEKAVDEDEKRAGSDIDTSQTEDDKTMAHIASLKSLIAHDQKSNDSPQQSVSDARMCVCVFSLIISMSNFDFNSAKTI